MADQSILPKRFAELSEQADAIENTKTPFSTNYASGFTIDSELLLAWRVNTRNLIDKVCGRKSSHYEEFIKQEIPRTHRQAYSMFKDLRAVFSATRKDFEGGYLNSFRNLVQAEVFSTELDQARELFKSGYITAAAVIAGVVLETTMRQLCIDRGIETGSLNKMNADLVKSGHYNQLIAKRITALAEIRNNAAHGKTGEFKPDHVRDMIVQVENFLADQL